jgi:hypothetical protein
MNREDNPAYRRLKADIGGSRRAPVVFHHASFGPGAGAVLALGGSAVAIITGIPFRYLIAGVVALALLWVFVKFLRFVVMDRDSEVRSSEAFGHPHRTIPGDELGATNIADLPPDVRELYEEGNSAGVCSFLRVRWSW